MLLSVDCLKRGRAQESKRKIKAFSKQMPPRAMRSRAPLCSGPHRTPGAKARTIRLRPGFLQRALSSFTVPDPENLIDR